MAGHFSNLYSSEIPYNQTLTDDFLEHLDLPKLTPSEAELLDSPISLDELKEALGEMKKGASPGFDGIPPELILKFWSLLGPPLTENDSVLNRTRFSTRKQQSGSNHPSS